jgi:hypothetical protein
MLQNNNTFKTKIPLISDSDMKKLIITLFTLMLVLPVLASADVLINEVELNPESGNDWVELYNNGNDSENITDWSVWTNGANECDAITETSLAADDYLIVECSSYLINNEAIMLYNIDYIEQDKFPDASNYKVDNDGDDRTWQRSPNGNDTNSENDWSYKNGTPDYSNDYLRCDEEERDDDTNWTACIAGEQSRTTYSCNTNTGEWDPTNNTYDECEWDTCSGGDSQARAYYEVNNTETTNETNYCTWNGCGDYDLYKKSYDYYTTNATDGTNVDNVNWAWCNYTVNQTYWETNFTVYHGWNLFSIPYYLINNSVESVFGEHSATNNYTIYGYYPELEGEDKWKTFPYTNGDDPSALKTLVPPHAYWINIEAPMGDKNVVLEGTFTSDMKSSWPIFELTEGWHLFGKFGLNYDRYQTSRALWAYTPTNYNDNGYYDYKAYSLGECNQIEYTNSRETYLNTECTFTRNAYGGVSTQYVYESLFVPTYGYWVYVYDNRTYIPGEYGGGTITNHGIAGDYYEEFPIFSHSA